MLLLDNFLIEEINAETVPKIININIENKSDINLNEEKLEVSNKITEAEISDNKSEFDAYEYFQNVILNEKKTSNSQKYENWNRSSNA